MTKKFLIEAQKVGLMSTIRRALRAIMHLVALLMYRVVGATESAPKPVSGIQPSQLAFIQRLFPNGHKIWLRPPDHSRTIHTTKVGTFCHTKGKSPRSRECELGNTHTRRLLLQSWRRISHMQLHQRPHSPHSATPATLASPSLRRRGSAACSSTSRVTGGEGFDVRTGARLSCRIGGHTQASQAIRRPWEASISPAPS